MDPSMTCYEALHVRPAVPSDISAIASIHLAAFPGFFLTQLGRPFLSSYYRLILQIEGGILLVGESEGTVAGFVAGFVDPQRFYRTMSSRKMRFALALLRGFLFRPWLLSRILWNYKRVSQSRQDSVAQEKNACELSSIAVLPLKTRLGLGAALVDRFLNCARLLGSTAVFLTTDTINNDQVNRFYQRLGFQIINQFEAGGKRMMNAYFFPLVQDGKLLPELEGL